MSHQQPARAAGQAATAGFLNTDWNPRDLPLGTTTRNVVLRTADGAATSGSLYGAGSADTVVCIMHPREFMACHYLIPDIVEAGFAAWTQAPRSVGNDMRLEHEFALYDVAAGMQFLREAGFRKIVLLGNSGGSGLYALYVQQSNLAPTERIERTPGGRPTRLAALDMPQIDGVVFVAPHPGQGALLQTCIDPSVTNEHDALSVDPALDPFDTANGYAPRRADGATETRYTDDFVTRYRAAQAARVARLDATARDLIAARQGARERLKRAPGNTDARLHRMAAHTPLMTIWRTDADLRCFDLTLDPSDRRYGSLWGSDPFTSNYGSVGFGRVCSPEAWLSTWSGLSSNALLSKTAPAIVQPTLLIEYTGDQACFPSVITEIYERLGTSHKSHRRVRGDHHGRALAEGEEAGRYVAGRLLRDWLRETFPS
ncbi:alpha/beta hydrolase family protein [Pandoraea capi]|uniref:Alpha/beta hydrolase family protein n=1 Tax=Pandoraea capi TaxID=2508286 RepID=A0ABY6WC63_9BURK|nr:alpha/beta hydrolase [Pandoraea capi]VVE45174.1 alpha/beta hydrolase family protein [Pandoraea capi]